MSAAAPTPLAPRGPRSWVRAFTGFYRPSGEDLGGLDPVARFLYAARSVILVISAQAAAIAGLLALTDRRGSPLAWVLVLVAFVLLHMISNLSNDFYGHRRGYDTPDSPRLRYTLHPVSSGALDARTLGGGIAALSVAVLAIGAYFVALRGLVAVWFAVAGGLLLWLYDAAPVRLKAVGFGELAAFAVWGPLMVGGGYVMVTGRVTAAPFLASVPYGLGVMSILVGKHVDQRDFDLAHGEHTLPVLLGERRARRLNMVTVVAMYVVLVALVATGVLSPFALIALIAASRAARAVRLMARPRPAAPPAGYVGWPLWYHRACLVHDRLFGWAYLAGLALGALVPSLRV